VLGICVVCALSATARIITPYTAAAMAGLWLWGMLRGGRASRRSWTTVTAAAAVGAVLGALWIKLASAPLTTLSLLSATTSGAIRRYADIPPWYAENLPSRLAIEIGNIATSPVLVVFLVLALVACVTAWRTVVPWLVVPAWLGALGVFLINPAATFFRYEIEVLPACIVAVAVLADQLVAATRRSVGRRLDVQGQRGDQHVDAGQQRPDRQQHAAGRRHRRPEGLDEHPDADDRADGHQEQPAEEQQRDRGERGEDVLE
jgi:hypothetical protein